MAQMTFLATADDGHVYHTHATWATLHGAGTGTSINNTAGDALCRTIWISPNYYLYRMFVPFYTFGLPDTAIITVATLALYGRAGHQQEDDAGHMDLMLQEGRQATPITIADFDSFNAPLLTDGAYAWAYPLNTGAYNVATLNSAGRGVINKTGLTYFCIRAKGDYDNTAPPGYNKADFFANEKGAGFEPKLVVTYTLPAGRSHGYIIG